MLLYNEILKNAALQFVDDAIPGQLYTIHDIVTLPETETKQLAFLYIDNSWSSVRTLLSFLKSPHAIALLSPSLPDHFKSELENLYKPGIIFDGTRTEMAGYTADDNALFFAHEDLNYAIADQVKVLLSTSGTTGSPKFVKLSEENLLQNALSIAAYLPISGTDVTPLNLPVYYSYGLSVLTSNALKGGIIVCSDTDVLNRDFWQKMDTYGYTSIAGVPFVYEMLDRIGFTKKTYPSLKYFTQAGGKLQEPLIRKMADYAAEKNIRFYVMYGQTEATARMSYLPPEKINDKIASIGIAIPNGRLVIETESSELLYSGPNVFGGYVSHPDNLSSFTQEEWLHTGDLARVDDDGYYYITGRLKRFVKLFGNRINLDEVESLIAEEFEQPVKCIGIEDKKIILAGDSKNWDIGEAAKFVVATLKLHPTTVKTLVIDAIPLTANGKPDYSGILKIYLEQ